MSLLELSIIVFDTFRTTMSRFLIHATNANDAISTFDTVTEPASIRTTYID